jgi:hypothetical protein
MSLACLNLAGCCGAEGRQEVFHDDFEADCSGLPCGWTVDSGSAKRVVTYHSGEHGLELTEGAVVWRSASARIFSPYPDSSPATIHVFVRCDEQTSLRLAMEYSQASQTDILTGTITGGWGSQNGNIISDRSITLQPGLLNCESENPDCQVQRIELEVSGPGACTIDSLRILTGYNHHCMG